jgi:hypothetical protein
VAESQRNEAEPFEPALRPQFGLKALALSLVAVSLTFALSRWLPTAIVVAAVFSGGLVALHVFSTALGRKLRASRPDEREKRQGDATSSSRQWSNDPVAGEIGPIRSTDAGELRERRSVASLASWSAVLAGGACLGAACGWSFIADARIVGQSSPSFIVPAVGLAAFGFLGAVAGGLSHALAASLFVAHRQSVQASEAEGPRS